MPSPASQGTRRIPDVTSHPVSLYFEREHIVKNFVLGVMTCIVVGPVVRQVIISTTKKLNEATEARESGEPQTDAAQA